MCNIMNFAACILCMHARALTHAHPHALRITSLQAASGRYDAHARRHRRGVAAPLLSKACQLWRKGARGGYRGRLKDKVRTACQRTVPCHQCYLAGVALTTRVAPAVPAGSASRSDGQRGAPSSPPCAAIGTDPCRSTTRLFAVFRRYFVSPDPVASASFHCIACKSDIVSVICHL